VLSQFVLALEVAAFDGDAASRYGDVRASLAKRGTPIGPLDTLIAAHALELDLVLVTHASFRGSRVCASDRLKGGGAHCPRKVHRCREQPSFLG